MISTYYTNLISALSTSAHKFIPVLKSNTFKNYWSDNLNELKAESIQAHNVWKGCGKPATGWVNQIRLHCKYKYKLAIRKADADYSYMIDDEISKLYLKKDFNKFWHIWKSKFNKSKNTATCINGFTTNDDIANEFSRHNVYSLL